MTRERGVSVRPAVPRLRGDVLLSLAILAATAAPLLLSPVRAWLLGPEGRGNFALFQADLSAIAAVGMLGARLASYSLQLDQRVRRDVPLRGLMLSGMTVALLLTAPLAVLAYSSAGSLIGWCVAACFLLVPGWILCQLELAR